MTSTAKTYAADTIVYVLRRTEDTVAPTRGTVVGDHEDGFLVNVPEEGGQRAYRPEEIYPSEPAAALVLAEEKLATAERVRDGQSRRLVELQEDVEQMKRTVANLRRAAKAHEPKAAPRRVARTAQIKPSEKTFKTASGREKAPREGAKPSTKASARKGKGRSK